jgi:hypothetical protein
MKRLILFALFISIFSMVTAETMHVKRLDDGSIKSGIIDQECKIPSQAEFDSIICSVKKIVWFEKTVNKDDWSLKQEDEFVKNLMDWKEKTYLHLSSIFNSLTSEKIKQDKVLYADLDTILTIVQFGDLLSLHERLVKKFWTMHPDAGKDKLSFPIWSEKEKIAFLKKFEETPGTASAAQIQPTISRQEKNKPNKAKPGSIWEPVDAQNMSIGY